MNRDSREIHWHNDEFHEFYAAVEISKIRICSKFLPYCIFLFETNIHLEFIATIPRFPFHSRLETGTICFGTSFGNRHRGRVKGAKFALIFLDRVPNPRPRNRSQFANNLHESPGNSTAEWLDRSIMKHTVEGRERGGGKKRSKLSISRVKEMGLRIIRLIAINLRMYVKLQLCSLLLLIFPFDFSFFLGGRGNTVYASIYFRSNETIFFLFLLPLFRAN